MTRRGWLFFIAVGILWGLPYLLIKISVREISPPLLVLIRTGGASVVLMPLAASRGALLPALRRWRPILAYTVAELAVPWVLLSSAERRLPSSLTGLLISAVPLVAAILAWTTGSDHVDLRRLVGLLVGLGGVGLLVGFDVTGSQLVDVASLVAVVVGYALGPWIIARHLSGVPAIGVLAWSLVFCAAAYAPIAAFALPTRPLSASVVESAAALTVVCTIAAFLCFFALIKEVGAMRATLVTYVNPAVAVVLGVTVLGEAFGPATGVGFVIVLGGCFLATRAIGPRRTSRALRRPTGMTTGPGDHGEPAFAAEPVPFTAVPELGNEDATRCDVAEELAATLASEALRSLGPAERRRRRRIAALAADDASRTFMIELTDQVLRIRTPRRAAARLADLVRDRPSPAIAGRVDKIALRAAASLASVAPAPVVALATARLRRELRALVLPAEAGPLGRHLRRRRAQGMRLNVNLLGEAVLGEGQAGERARLVEALLNRTDVDCVSVKLSALYSQMDVLSYEHSLDEVRRRLRPILRAAANHRPPKLVYFDMEEYRDLHITVDAFTSLLEEAPFERLQAGLALQAYLPDSVLVLESLCAFARRRHEATGASIRVRIVKGANLAMERVEAELRGWPQAPFATKEEVDANFKRLLDVALAAENTGALYVGVASHNLFDVAWALTRDAETGGGRVEIEMLEGMAVAEAEAVARAAGGILLYAPVVQRHDFESAVAYLVRRFDENTAPENYLAHLSSLAPGSTAWEAQRRRFRQAVADRHLPPAPSRREAAPGMGAGEGAHTPAGASRRGRDAVEAAPFSNVADTDWSVAANRDVLALAMQELSSKPSPGPVYAVVDGEAVTAPLTGSGIDPSRPRSEWYRYVEADLPTVERAVDVARRAARRWGGTPPEERRRLLHRAADGMARERSHTIARMIADGGKVVREADAEVSEAIDGARYYGDQAVELAHRHDGAAAFDPYGVAVVTPPWNFPYAIPSGGVFASLAAGNAVILKPAPETVLTAATIVAQCHGAGIPMDVLQFVPCADDETGRRLVTHPDVDAVVLTGAWDTARRFLEWRPGLHLHAETSGKNAIVVMASADLEDAVRDIVHSAFSHAGQKCSAASLAILEAPVYDDPRFLDRLADAVSSLRVGPATDLSTRVGPLIRPPSGPLLRALTSLGPGERWLVEPHQTAGNPHLWSPGVKLGVAPGSELHLTECFGPVLGLMRARNLDHAIELQNATPYGLTGGISSLDEREVHDWSERVAAGNVYANRHITGAIVRRQPFGGWKRSSIGPGAKAGGPNYVASLGQWRRVASLDVGCELAAARVEMKRLLAGEDPSDLVSEANVFRIRPLHHGVLRLGSTPDSGALEVSLGVAAALGVTLELSSAVPQEGLIAGAIVEDDDAFVARLVTARLRPEHVRVAGGGASLRLALLDAGFDVDVEPLVAIGTHELLRWTREQAVSATEHRHGNVVGTRDGHVRAH